MAASSSFLSQAKYAWMTIFLSNPIAASRSIAACSSAVTCNEYQQVTDCSITSTRLDLVSLGTLLCTTLHRRVQKRLEVLSVVVDELEDNE